MPRRYPGRDTLARMADFAFQDLLPLGADETPYRLITGDHVSTFAAAGASFLRVEPEALTLLTQQAMHDIAHYLRPGHLAQLNRILDDPEASPNDRYVARGRAPTPVASRGRACRTRASRRAASSPCARTPAPRW